MVQLHLEEPSALKDASRSFTVLKDPVYANKNLGSSGQLEVMTCECGHHAQSTPHTNSRARNADLETKPKQNGHRHGSNGKAEDEEDNGDDEEEEEELCGPSSNCINRLTYMECYDDYCCDVNCANRRFQKHQYARIDIFNAGKKGYGVRALEAIPEGAFIYEYTGEVLDEQRFQKRQQKYDREGVKHFYFMMLQKDEFIDATEKGSIARFCNHSCNPNAQIEKWVVGPKLRMGLFAKRDIVRGEEICFDYKVDRYGSKAQPCYCGEPNCSGFLGGRTQTGGTLLPPSVVEGLGLDSEIALGWPESALQKLQLHASELGQDLESVLLNVNENETTQSQILALGEAQNHDGSQEADQKQSLSQSPSRGQSQSPSRDLSQSPSQDQSQSPSQDQSQSPNQDQNQSPSQDQSPNPSQNRSLSPSQDRSQSPNQGQSQGPNQDRNPGQSQSQGKKASRRRGRNKTADLIGLLDAPSSSLSDSSKAGQQLLVSQFPLIELSNDQLPEFMRILMQTQDRGWLIALMLGRVLKSPHQVQLAILQMHGYEIMATVLNRWRDQFDVLQNAIEVLYQWPKVTRNKISSSQIESVVRDLCENSSIDENIRTQASSLLKEWKGLAMGYRIPRRKITDAAPSSPSGSTSHESPAPGSGTKPPANNTVEGSAAKSNSDAPASGSTPTITKKDLREKKPARPLPEGWESRTSSSGKTYYYNSKEDVTSWTLPVHPRDSEREARIREKELKAERDRQAQLLKEREEQASEIQRIIDEAAADLPSVSSVSSNQPLSESSTASTPRKLKGERKSDAAKSPAKAKKTTLESVFAAYVPKLIFAAEDKIGRDRCKRHARDVVHILVKKEQAKGTDPSKLELTPERKNKIKGFVKEYMTKVLARHESKGHEPKGHEPKAGHHDSNSRTPKRIKRE